VNYHISTEQIKHFSRRRSGVLSPGYIVREESVQWFPWLGTRGLLTLELHARCDGISVETDLLSITHKKTSLDRWHGHLASIRGGNHNALNLAQHMGGKDIRQV